MRDRELAAQLQALPDDELTRTRRGLQAGLGLMAPGSPMYAPARAYVDAVTAAPPGATVSPAPRAPDPRGEGTRVEEDAPAPDGCRGVTCKLLL